MKIDNDGTIIENTSMNITHIHGTAVALTIKHICSNVEFICLNILDQNLKTDGRLLIYALNKSLIYEPNIINLSLGTRKLRYYFSFKKFIRKVKKKNIIIIAAADNTNCRCYPAYLHGVVGVKSKIFNNYRNYLYENNFYYAHPFINNVPGYDELNNNTLYGNSFAAAYITGQFANKLLNNSIPYLNSSKFPYLL